MSGEERLYQKEFTLFEETWHTKHESTAFLYMKVAGLPWMLLGI